MNVSDVYFLHVLYSATGTDPENVHASIATYLTDWLAHAQKAMLRADVNTDRQVNSTDEGMVLAWYKEHTRTDP